MTQSLKESALAFMRRFEWADLFPAPLEFHEAQSWRGPELNVNSHGFMLFQNGGPGIDLAAQSAEVSCETVEALKGILAKRKRIALSIDQDLTLTSSVDIPLTSDRVTEQILRLRRIQEIPAKPQDYLHSWFDDPSQSNNASRRVIDVVVRRDMMERVFAQLRSVGSQCDMVFIRNGLAAALPFAWDSNGLAYKRNEIKIWVRRTWFSLTCAGFAGVLFASALLHQQSSIISSIDDQLTELEPEAKRITQQAHANDIFLIQVAQLVDRTSPSRLASVQLEMLAELLPDDTVLTAFQFDSGLIVIEGLATAPEGLVEILSKQKNFKDVAFAAPVFRNPGEEKSRFVMRFALAEKLQ
jgi:Tfp pilus assembly protein PilN